MTSYYRLGQAIVTKAQNVPDLYRVWRGPKWFDERAPNMGLMRMIDKQQVLSDIVTSIRSDWDEDVTEKDIDKVITLLKSFNNLEYLGKICVQQMLAGTKVEVRNGNDFTIPSPRPFAKISTLHPNEGDTNPVVSWHGVTTSDGASIRISAIAFNPEPGNPGAILEVRLVGEREGLVQREVLKLRPMIHGFTAPMPAPFGPFTIEMEVKKAEDASASFAGIRMEMVVGAR